MTHTIWLPLRDYNVWWHWRVNGAKLHCEPVRASTVEAAIKRLRAKLHRESGHFPNKDIAIVEVRLRSPLALSA